MIAAAAVATSKPRRAMARHVTVASHPFGVPLIVAPAMIHSSELVERSAFGDRIPPGKSHHKDPAAAFSGATTELLVRLNRRPRCIRRSHQTKRPRPSPGARRNTTGGRARNGPGIRIAGSVRGRAANVYK